MKIWEVHYAFRPESPTRPGRRHAESTGPTTAIYHPNYDHHVYRNLSISETDTEPFNRGHDDQSVQYGPLTVDGLTFDGISGYCRQRPPDPDQRQQPDRRGCLVLPQRPWSSTARTRTAARSSNVGGGTRTPPQHPARRADLPARLLRRRAATRRSSAPAPATCWATAASTATSRRSPATSRAWPRSEIDFPTLLDPANDMPPATVITRRQPSGRRLAPGPAGPRSSDQTIRSVRVNGLPATPVEPNFAQWEVVVKAASTGANAHRARRGRGRARRGHAARPPGRLSHHSRSAPTLGRGSGFA